MNSEVMYYRYSTIGIQLIQDDLFWHFPIFRNSHVAAKCVKLLFLSFPTNSFGVKLVAKFLFRYMCIYYDLGFFDCKVFNISMIFTDSLQNFAESHCRF